MRRLEASHTLQAAPVLVGQAGHLHIADDWRKMARRRSCRSAAAVPEPARAIASRDARSGTWKAGT